MCERNERSETKTIILKKQQQQQRLTISENRTDEQATRVLTKEKNTA